jgi:translocation and assembly module TamA
MNRYLFLIIFLLSLGCAFADAPYIVEYEGISDKNLIEMLKSVSQLETLRKHPPATRTALNRRVEADIPNLAKVLQTDGYYKPEITFTIDTSETPYVIHIFIDPGDIHIFKKFIILPYGEDDSPLQGIAPEDLGIIPGAPAYPEQILEAESRLLQILGWSGYPLARIREREVIADEEDKTISVTLLVDTGLPVVFGPTTITGLTGVNPLFICRKILWYRGLPFNPFYLEKTQQDIEESGLFASVTISMAEELNEYGELPIAIDLIESKHRTIALGASYTTQLGPGILAEWELRNMRGLGERFGVSADIWKIRQRGAVMYRQPDFRIIGQDILWIGEFEHEKTPGYTETFFSITNLVEWQVNLRTNLSYGLQFKGLDSDNSDNDGIFSLLKAPVHLRWSNANNLMDPTRGMSLNIKLVPTWSLLRTDFIYYIQTLVATFYYTFDKHERWTVASKVDLGTIFGAKNRTIPPPERFYAGNEHTLRGYDYMTVSPLDNEGKPLGGRSLLVYSLELRSRLGEKVGWVAFYEVGNVYTTIVPNLDHKQLQSVGFGLRYQTPVGPLRADVAVPLDRRQRNDGSYIDNPYELYFSIGQAF